MMWSRRALFSIAFVSLFALHFCVAIAEKQHDVSSILDLSPSEIEEKLQVCNLKYVYTAFFS